MTKAATDGGRSTEAGASSRSRRTDLELESYFTAFQSAAGDAWAGKGAADRNLIRNSKTNYLLSSRIV